MSRTMTRFMTAVGVLVVMIALAIAVVPKAFADDYTYTVRLWGGNAGTSQDVIWEETYSYNDRCTLPRAVAEANVPSDSKYYVKGFREGGKDALSAQDFPVTEDKDFVIAYGMRGDQVSYTVNYVEYGTGTALTGSDSGKTSVTYFGNRGDKPVVAYEHIPGYRPRYRNVTGTLGEEGTNNWTLEYIPDTSSSSSSTSSGTSGGTTGGTTTPPVATATTPPAPSSTPSTTGTNTGTSNTNTSSTDNSSTNSGSNQAATATTPATPVTPPATEEVLDVDNPLANGTDNNAGAQNDTGKPAEEEKAGSGIPKAAIFGIAIALVVAAGIVAYLLTRRRGNDDGGDDGFGGNGGNGPSAFGGSESASSTPGLGF